ncbi:Rab family, other [Strigomonas culicis]|uniref:Rab family, other n=1 Tax=Strigomonas culicis TaxID=28005 RepID=S9W2R9_9TRYP|nr:Rab family, other [Strigomonas culicis]|eukprot:EPY33616.1 Rab family, other [Strigomonas culicis]
MEERDVYKEEEKGIFKCTRSVLVRYFSEMQTSYATSWECEYHDFFLTRNCYEAHEDTNHNNNNKSIRVASLMRRNSDTAIHFLLLVGARVRYEVAVALADDAALADAVHAIRLQQLQRDLIEGLDDALRVLGATLRAQQGVLDAVGLALRRRHLPRRLAEVLLVAKDEDERVGGVRLQLAHPVLGVLEGVVRREVVRDHRGGGPAVVHRGEAAVALLAGRVPDVEAKFRARVRGARRERRVAVEGGADGAAKVLVPLALEPLHERGFADAAVAEEDDLIPLRDRRRTAVRLHGE